MQDFEALAASLRNLVREGRGRGPPAGLSRENSSQPGEENEESAKKDAREHLHKNPQKPKVLANADSQTENDNGEKV